MIRIPLDQNELQRLLDSKVPNWGTLTSEKRWNRLKPLFIDAQHNKCAYCEAEIGGRLGPAGDRDTQTQDVEHFRPKNEIKSWSAPSGWDMKFDIETGPSDGYPWLAYDELNYVASCIPCNRSNKKNFFPIAKIYSDYASQPGVEELRKEKPFLIFPAATVTDTNPEELISFLGSNPVPHPSLTPDNMDYWRAMVTISVLNLERADLDVPRKKLIFQMTRSYVTALRVSSDLAIEVLATCTRPEEPFSSCARSFRSLVLKSPEIAKNLAIACARELPASLQPGDEELKLVEEWKV